MKTYILSYNFNGVNHVAKIYNIASCLQSLLSVAPGNSIENVTITQNKAF